MGYFTSKWVTLPGTCVLCTFPWKLDSVLFTRVLLLGNGQLYPKIWYCTHRKKLSLKFETFPTSGVHVVRQKKFYTGMILYGGNRGNRLHALVIVLVPYGISSRISISKRCPITSKNCLALTRMADQPV